LSKPSTTDPEAHKLPDRAAVSFGTKAYEYARQMAGSPGLIEVYNMTTGWTASRLEYDGRRHPSNGCGEIMRGQSGSGRMYM